MNNRIDQIFKIVNDTALDDEFRFNGYQITLLERYFLHKLTDLSMDEIGELTSACKIKVYNSIQRVDQGKRFDEIKFKIFQAVKENKNLIAQ